MNFYSKARSSEKDHFAGFIATNVVKFIAIERTSNPVKWRSDMSGQVLTDRADFWANFSLLYNSGVPILETFSVVSQGTDGELRKVASKFGKTVEEGKYISEVMAKHQDVFSNLETIMITVGEETGTVGDILEKLAEVSRIPETSAKADFWKNFALLMSCGLQILPALEIASEGMDDDFRKVISDVRDSISSGISISGALAQHEKMFSVFEISMVRVGADVGNLPIIAERLAEVSRIPETSAKAGFWRNFALLVSCGLPILRVLEVASEGMDDDFRKAVSGVKDSVNSGASLSDALEQNENTFSAFEVSMVRAGEAAGNLNVIAERLAAS
jgi:type II secretory pathway component PulF